MVDATDGRSSVDLDENPKSSSFKRFGVLLGFLLIFSLFPLFLSVIFGGLLALVEGVAFIDGFLYVASNLLNMATPLTDYNPNNPAGILIDVYVSVVALLCFGIMLNLVNLFQVPLAINNAIKYWVTSVPILVPLFALMLVIPFSVAILGVVFGSLMAVVEGWAVHDGILYVFSNLLGLGTGLVEIFPQTTGGDILDIIISSLALGCAAIFIDYVTVLNPARYVRTRFRTLLVARGVIQLANTPNLHPLDYNNNLLSSTQQLITTTDGQEKTTDGQQQQQQLLPRRKCGPSSNSIDGTPSDQHCINYDDDDDYGNNAVDVPKPPRKI
jgi:hypothetical protein